MHGFFLVFLLKKTFSFFSHFQQIQFFLLSLTIFVFRFLLPSFWFLSLSPTHPPTHKHSHTFKTSLSHANTHKHTHSLSFSLSLYLSHKHILFFSLFISLSFMYFVFLLSILKCMDSFLSGRLFVFFVGLLPQIYRWCSCRLLYKP